MRVKTFRGKSTRQVLAQIKAELGEDAIILSNQTMTEDGRTICEVMAAVETQNPRPAARKAEAEAEAQPSPGLQAFGPEHADETGAELWQKEWGQIKGHLLALLGSRMDLDALTPRQRLAMEYLEREGADQNVLLTLWRRLRKKQDASVLSILSEIVGVRPFTPEAWPHKFHALVGPHGVGKTTCLIRLALEHKRAAPSSRILIANADDSQGKGRLFLQHYAELSGLAYREIGGPEDFQAIERASRDYDKVFIDLPGLGGDRLLADFLKQMGLDRERLLQLHLVLSPYFSPAQLSAFLRKYGSAHLSSLIWTKLDEACNFGEMVNVALLTELPVSALSYGPGLRNSLALAEGMLLWKLIFKHRLPTAEETPAAA